MGSQSQQVWRPGTTTPVSCMQQGGPAGLGCGASPKKSGDLGPPHQSAACSKTRPQIVKVGRQASDDGVPSQFHLGRKQNVELTKSGDHHTSQLQGGQAGLRSLETTTPVSCNFPNKRVPDKRVLPWECYQQAEK
ncbi:uncharacterized protein ACJ7VT_019704 isoform 1-T1 [Polymixia lowei]